MHLNSNTPATDLRARLEGLSWTLPAIIGRAFRVAGITTGRFHLDADGDLARTTFTPCGCLADVDDFNAAIDAALAVRAWAAREGLTTTEGDRLDAARLRALADPDGAVLIGPGGFDTEPATQDGGVA